MKEQKRNKIKFNRKRLVITAILFSLSIVAYSSGSFVPDDHRYVRQLTVLFGTVLLIIAFISFLKLFTYEIRRELYRRISAALFNAAEKWRIVKKWVRGVLGLPERVDLGGKDERQIVFDDSERARRRAAKLPKLKYSDLSDNRSRIRFLWAKYVIDRADKEDPPAVGDTPREIEKKLPDEDGKDGLFGLYHTARYAKDNAPVPDGEVVRYAKFVGTSGKI